MGTWCFDRVSWTSLLCGMEPKAFTRSSHSTDRLPLFSLASQISCVTTLVCFRHPDIPEMSPFWTDDVGVLCQVGTQPFGNGIEENLCLNTQYGDDDAELINLGGVFLLRDPNPFSHSPLVRDPPPSPEDLQDFAQTQQQFGTVLIHFVWSAMVLEQSLPLLCGQPPWLLSAAAPTCWTAQLVQGVLHVCGCYTLPTPALLGVTVRLLQMLVYVFLRGGQFATALLPQQILGELKGVSDESSTFACSLSPQPTMPPGGELWSSRMHISWTKPLVLPPSTGISVLSSPAWCYESWPLRS